MLSRAGFFLFLVVFLFTGCKKIPNEYYGNRAPYYDKIPTVLIENYVNRLYIDLIGREPLDVEMVAEVEKLKNKSLGEQAREELILRLQTDTTYREGDISYKRAYYHRFYELCKVRCLEGASNSIFAENIGNYNFAIVKDSLNGDSLGMEISKSGRQKEQNVLDAESDYFNDSITVNEVMARMLNNSVYDQINMNTFNFVNASFDDLFFRFPTQAEFENGFNMIEYNRSLHLLGQSGQNKGDYIYILSRSREFYQGMITWAYITLLARYPASAELAKEFTIFYNTGDFQKVQRNIMKTDEYANF